ncbi:MAG: hypothetical protein IPJ51_13890 [Saprospiraceae bacterium]|nr:hypothetical protein [Saprospiraceae bacterium]
MIIKKVPYYVSLDYDFLKLHKNLKWLKNFGISYSAHISFLNKLNENLKPQIEIKLNKKLDWNIIYLDFDPSDSFLFLYTKEIENSKYYSIDCSISNGIGINYYGRIIWMNAITKDEFDFRTDVTDVPIAFMWIPGEDSEEDGLSLPSYTENQNISKVKLKNKIKFPVETYLLSMPHEGKFAITLWNTEDTEKVSTSLDKARSDWNKQTDKSRETGDESLERGYCHDIAFDGLDGKVGYWYVDAGSAHDGIHEFLLKGLSESGVKIKHVEIQGL